MTNKIGPNTDPCGTPLYTRAFQFAIRFYSIRYANRLESILLLKNLPFDSLVVMQFLY